MDFEMLSRRELQALCKRNKIPANMTNLAMTDALKALKIVEGFEELQSSRCESTQSSIESPERNEVTSPYLPPTGGRTTRRRTVTKEEPRTSQPTTRTRRTAKKSQNNAAELNADATETPAVVQTRRRAPSSVCRSMESELKECAEEKEVLATPAPSGVASRRRTVVKEESVVQKVYSTRRSTRLASKSEKKLDVVENETSVVNKYLFAKEGDENVKLGDFDETSGTTTGLANTNVEENLEGKDESEVISAEKQPISSGGFDANTSVEENIDRKDNESQVVSADEQNMLIGEGTELAANAEEKMGNGFEACLEQEEKEAISFQNDKVVSADETEAVVVDEEMLEQEEKEASGFQNDKVVSADETEAVVVDEEMQEQEEKEVSGGSENDKVGSEVEVNEEKHEQEEKDVSGGSENDKVGSADESEVEVNEEMHEQEEQGEMPKNSEDLVVENLGKPLNVSNEDDDAIFYHEKIGFAVDTKAEVVEENCKATEVEEGDGILENAGSDVEAEVEVNQKNCEKSEYPTVENAESQHDHASLTEVAAESVQDLNMDGDESHDSVENVVLESGAEENEIMFDESSESVIPVAKEEKSDDVMYQDTDDSSETVKSTCLPVISNNKENVSNGSTFIYTAEPKPDMSLRLLTKMLKEKLIITSKLNKTENGTELPARVALQAVTENRLVDETKK